MIDHSKVMDIRLREALWKGSIPVKIDLSLNDITSLDTPTTFYTNVPRMSYLSLLLRDLKLHFDSFAPSGVEKDQLWLEYNQHPLNLIYPTGVLYDLKREEESTLPWSLVLHYRGLPEDIIPKCSGIDMIRFNFINSLKEAFVIKSNSAKEILNMAKETESKFLHSIFKWDWTTFREINEQIGEVSIENILRSPIKIFIDKLSNPLLYPSDVQTEEKEDKTIGAYLLQLFPNLVIAEKKEDNGFNYSTINPSTKIIIQGIEADLNTPVYWMGNNLCYLDQFVYIVIRV